MRNVDAGKRVLTEHLRNIAMFQYLHQWERERLLPLCRLLHVDAGETIIAQDETSPNFYAIVKGRVSVVVQQEPGKEIRIGTVTDGQVFGEAAIFVDVKRIAKVVAETEVDVINIDGGNLLGFMRESTETGFKILMYMVYSLIQKLRETNQELALERSTPLDPGELARLLAHEPQGKKNSGPRR